MTQILTSFWMNLFRHWLLFFLLFFFLTSLGRNFMQASSYILRHKHNKNIYSNFTPTLKMGIQISLFMTSFGNIINKDSKNFHPTLNLKFCQHYFSVHSIYHCQSSAFAEKSNCFLVPPKNIGHPNHKITLPDFFFFNNSITKFQKKNTTNLVHLSF